MARPRNAWIRHQTAIASDAASITVVNQATKSRSPFIAVRPAGRAAAADPDTSVHYRL
ncbi:hypothetical protein GCM10027440_25900 [Nocardiopsis coralliicola]